jgi:hypothetical protein
MRFFVITAAMCGLLTSPVFAQGAPAQDGPPNPAVKSMNENNAMKPVAGANSFTMAQAQSAIEAKGFTQVTGLTKDAQGVWRGRAMKGGSSHPVSVDYQGNVN